ncbi:flocculation protein FLO11 [Toxotes jaculatrix]|uniref:flocculation protein FLO11 n=1 Tax=Toxotes jaculatrix TaxID=941984 RepID=UPI001B3ABD24|nr:flocculation protein FLO11 [Toxotes jaculatrix]
MQLHACLLLFIITTDKTLALLHHCNGNVSLDQEPVGHIRLTLSGLLTDTNRLNSMNHQPDKTLSLCTWTIDIPPGRTVLLKAAWLESGSSISVRCVGNEGDHDWVLESGGTALLSGCDRNKATLTWTGAGHSSNAIQMSYYVQEDERNSSEDHTSPHTDRDLIRWSQTGTSFTSTVPVSQEAVRGTEGVRGRLHEGLEWSRRLQSVSGSSSQDQGLLHPTSLLQGLTVAGRADRETLPFPEEGLNNGADTSGAVHLTDGPISARERTHPYFQHTHHTDTSNTANTETNSVSELPQTKMALTDATARSYNTFLGTETYKYAISHTSKHVDRHASTQAHPTVSSSSILLVTSSTPELPFLTTWESGTVLIPHGGAVSGTPEEKHPHSWRSQRSTDRLNSDLTSAITSDPLKSPTQPPQDDSSRARADTEPTEPSTSSQASTKTHQSSTAHITELDTAVSTVAAASFHPNISRSDSFESAASDVSSQTAAFASSDKFDNRGKLHTPTSSPESQTNSPQSTESLTHSTYTSSTFTQMESTQRNFINTFVTTNTAPSSPVITEAEGRTSSFTASSSTPRAALTLGDVVKDSAAIGTTSETYTLHPTYTLLHENSPTNSHSPVPPLPFGTSLHQSTTSQMHTAASDSSHTTHTPTSLTSVTESTKLTAFADHKTVPTSSQSSIVKSISSHTPLLSSTKVPAMHKQSHNYITTTHTSLLSLTTPKSHYGPGHRGVEVETEDEFWQRFPSSTTTHTPTAGPPPQPPPRTTPYPSQESHVTLTPSAFTSAPTWSSTASQTPKFYIVPDQPAAVRVESIELLLQIIVEESRSAFSSGLEEDTAAWIEPYLQKAPGFSRLLGVWSSGHAVQSLVEFKTSRALQWLSMTGPTSLLERTGLAQAVREGKGFRSSKITNITLGGLQGDVCDWLLQCPEGYKCVSQPGTANYSCSSVCHFAYCHHHGICTHHPGQLPICRCLVGEDFWYMGQRCDVRMTRARLVGACLAILLVMVTVIGVLAFVAVRRYRAILIQAKVDQTRSSYRRFNHFDELSGRFWLRSWAGSADSLDNPAFTRSDELLHLRALDRPCCYHDDTLSLASTCPSHGTHINTIYPHSSRYGWRGSEMSMGDGVLDSGKASDLSVCSWPVEPIQWTPFPLLQQLASHRTPTVRVSRPRSYCEGMELADLGKSWTA